MLLNYRSFNPWIYPLEIKHCPKDITYCEEELSSIKGDKVLCLQNVLDKIPDIPKLIALILSFQEPYEKGSLISELCQNRNSDICRLIIEMVPFVWLDTHELLRNPVGYKWVMEKLRWSFNDIIKEPILLRYFSGNPEAWNYPEVYNHKDFDWFLFVQYNANAYELLERKHLLDIARSSIDATSIDATGQFDNRLYCDVRIWSLTRIISFLNNYQIFYHKTVYDERFWDNCFMNPTIFEVDKDLYESRKNALLSILVEIM